MIKFKQFINLVEERIEKFVNIKDVEDTPDGKLDPNSPVHQQMTRLYGNIPKEKRRIVDTETGKEISLKNPQDIKSFKHLHQLVHPEIKAVENIAQNRKEDEQAFRSGEAELIHHDPKTGAKIFSVHSAAGSCAAAAADGKDDTQWCTTSRSADNAFDSYHKTEDVESKEDEPHSFVMHFPQEKDKNLQKVGIYGIKKWRLHTTGLGGNFQKKDNTTVSDDEWNHLTKKYKLNDIPALEGVRGLGIEKQDPQAMLDRGGDSAALAIKNHPGITSGMLEDVIAKGAKARLHSEKFHDFGGYSTKDIYDSKGNPLSAYALEHPALSHDAMDRVINGDYHRQEFKASENDSGYFKHLEDVPNKWKGDENSNKWAKKSSNLDLGFLIRNPSLTSKHIDKILDRPDVRNIFHYAPGSGPYDHSPQKLSVMSHPNVEAHHITRVLSEPRFTTPESSNEDNRDVQGTMLVKDALANKHANTQHFISAINNPNDYVGEKAFNPENESITPMHISIGLSSPHKGVAQAAARHPNASSANLDQAISMQHTKVAAADNPALQPHHFKALIGSPEHTPYLDQRSEDRLARRAAAMNPSLPADVIRSHGITHSSDEVQRLSYMHPNAPEDVLLGGLDHPDKRIQMASALHKSTTPKIIEKMLSISNPQPFLSAIATDRVDHNDFKEKVKRPQIEMALNHPDKRVRMAVLGNPTLTTPTDTLNAIKNIPHSSPQPEADHETTADEAEDHYWNTRMVNSILGRPDTTEEHIYSVLKNPYLGHSTIKLGHVTSGSILSSRLKASHEVAMNRLDRQPSRWQEYGDDERKKDPRISHRVVMAGLNSPSDSARASALGHISSEHGGEEALKTIVRGGDQRLFHPDEVDHAESVLEKIKKARESNQNMKKWEFYR